MAWTVNLHDAVADWLDEQDDTTQELVIAALTVLAEQGPTLGRPLVDKITGSNLHNLKELRPGSVGRTEVRILFAFDPWREAILLVAGDKAGQWSKWYRKNIPIAEDRYADHVEELREEKS